MKQDDMQVGARYPCRYGPSRALVCLVCILIAAPSVWYAIEADPSEWPITMPILAATGGCVVFLAVVRRTEARKRRILCAIGRTTYLSAFLPCRTDEETLAILGEIHARYVETIGLADEIGSDGERLAGHMRDRLDKLETEYDAEAGRLRRADASVADLAKDVRGFSRLEDIPRIC